MTLYCDSSMVNNIGFRFRFKHAILHGKNMKASKQVHCHSMFTCPQPQDLYCSFYHIWSTLAHCSPQTGNAKTIGRGSLPSRNMLNHCKSDRKSALRYIKTKVLPSVSDGTGVQPEIVVAGILLPSSWLATLLLSPSLIYLVAAAFPYSKESLSGHSINDAT